MALCNNSEERNFVAKASGALYSLGPSLKVSEVSSSFIENSAEILVSILQIVTTAGVRIHQVKAKRKKILLNCTSQFFYLDGKNNI